MSLTALPVEVLENILKFLSEEETVNVWKVVGKDVSESFWARMCRRKGYVRVEGVDDSWRSVIQCSLNWRSGKFLYREYTLEGNLRHLSQYPRALIFKHELHCGNIISLDFLSDRLGIFNIDNNYSQIDPYQIMKDVKHFETSGSKLLVSFMSKHKIYTLRHSQYVEIYQTNFNPNLPSQPTLSNDFFAFEDHRPGSIRIVDLTKLEEFQCTVLQDRTITSMSICGSILNISYALESNFYLQRYSIRDRRITNSLFLSKGTDILFSELNLFISSYLVVHRNINDLKMSVRNTDGEYLSSFYYDCWMAVLEEYVIYSVHNKIYIWTAKKPNDGPKELLVDEDWIQMETKILFNSFLILPFPKCFKVIDIQKATYLYDVKLETSSLGTMFPMTGSAQFCSEEFNAELCGCSDEL
ncbi:uncharacterized protein LOC124353933 [Homalodisca vitripennis]|uniref:uncharacterized protein LOC124353933 n=1 Tax=Homalodisca vitripennis TaxID=197043 RepID=UPI001EEA89B3|nr:uncharacterized protein LOC124353933 [Homalodisca vitripennis]